MRKREVVTIDDVGPGNRDRGKRFVITEMSAYDIEMWGARAFLAMARSGIDIPEGIEGKGIAGIAAVGLTALSGVNFEEARELMDSMFRSIEIMPDPSKPEIVRPLMEEDIEEVTTRILLRLRWLELHTGFSFADLRSTLTSRSAPTTEEAQDSSRTPTSPQRSGPLSPQDRRAGARR